MTFGRVMFGRSKQHSSVNLPHHTKMLSASKGNRSHKPCDRHMDTSLKSMQFLAKVDSRCSMSDTHVYDMYTQSEYRCGPVPCQAIAARMTPPCSRCRISRSRPEVHVGRATQASARPALWSCGLARMTCRLPHNCSSTAHLRTEALRPILTQTPNTEPLGYCIQPAWQEQLIMAPKLCMGAPPDALMLRAQTCVSGSAVQRKSRQAITSFTIVCT